MAAGAESFPVKKGPSVPQDLLLESIRNTNQRHFKKCLKEGSLLLFCFV